MNTDLEWKDGIKFQVRENRTALVCSVVAVGFVALIVTMRFIHPSEEGGGALLYLPLFCMLAGGVACFLLYFHRKLIVNDANICYVNWIGKTRKFQLNEIGFGKMGAGASMNQVVLYDLNGKKLCKLDFEMQGIAEFYQYLADNGIEIEWVKKRVNHSQSFMSLVNVIQKETAVSEEEIRKCSESFYGEVERIFRDWENQNQKFHAEWEIGFAEYTAQDFERKCRLIERTSSVPNPLENIPESYECILEAYLKRDGEYVVSNRGEEVKIILPYLAKTKSYRIGEKTRIRKADEQNMEEWLEGQLETLTKELPKRRFHTEALVLGHKLHTTAGIIVKTPEKISETSRKVCRKKNRKKSRELSRRKNRKRSRELSGKKSRELNGMKGRKPSAKKGRKPSGKRSRILSEKKNGIMSGKRSRILTPKKRGILSGKKNRILSGKKSGKKI